MRVSMKLGIVRFAEVNLTMPLEPMKSLMGRGGLRRGTLAIHNRRGYQEHQATNTAIKMLRKLLKILGTNRKKSMVKQYFSTKKEIHLIL